MSMISYAQNYEDVMLVRALADIGEGFYVDVGAQHPINGSVTKAFQLRGWRGINIEPVERWFRLICEDRPNDINLRVPISDVPGYIDLFDVEDTGLSTVRQDYASAYSDDGWNVVKRRLRAHTLNAVFRAHAPSDVHFLKIDVEGAEASVLRSLDLGRFRPWIILIEATKPNSPEPVFEEWESLLIAASYIFAYDDGLNRFYVAREHEARIKYFSRPPNFFDDFMLYSESWARAQMNRLAQEVEFERSEALRFRKNYDAIVAKTERSENAQAEALSRVLDERLLPLGERLESRINTYVENGVDKQLERLGERLESRINTYVENGVDKQLERLGERLAFDHAESRAVTNAITELAGQISSIEAEMGRVHERLAFADNVHTALLDTLSRERATDAKLQQIVDSNSWRIMKGPRFIARTLRASIHRQRPIGSTAAPVPHKALATRLLLAVVRRPALRRIGSFFLGASPRLKDRLTRVVVSNAQPAAPPPPVFTEPKTGSYAHLPARARIVRSMLDNAAKSS